MDQLTLTGKIKLNFVVDNVDYEAEGKPLGLEDYSDEIRKMTSMTSTVTNRVDTTYLFSNGMILTFDNNGEQIPELQGRDSPELRRKIKDRSDNNTEWKGFVGEPLRWK